MMNMHGAVCASDRDMTILRYKDWVPFAIMVDPNSELPWEDIFDKFRVKHPDLTEDYVGTFKEYLEDYLPEYGDISAKDEKVFCIFYDKEKLFVAAKRLDIQVRKNFVKIKAITYNLTQTLEPYKYTSFCIKI